MTQEIIELKEYYSEQQDILNAFTTVINNINENQSEQNNDFSELIDQYSEIMEEILTKSDLEDLLDLAYTTMGGI